MQAFWHPWHYLPASPVPRFGVASPGQLQTVELVKQASSASRADRLPSLASRTTMALNVTNSLGPPGKYLLPQWPDAPSTGTD